MSAKVGIGITRREGESWRECVARYGRKHGLEEEVLNEFDIDQNPDEAMRAWGALLEWDIGDLFHGDGDE